LKFREENTFQVDTWDNFKTQIEIGGFIEAHWDGTSETEEKIKAETKAAEAGKCVYTGEPSPRRVVFAKSY
jgi:prolyl-tRNA synthetase